MRAAAVVIASQKYREQRASILENDSFSEPPNPYDSTLTKQKIYKNAQVLV